MAGGEVLLVAVGAVCTLTDAPTIDLRGPEVRLADISSLECVAPQYRAEIGALSIALVDRERAITRGALAGLARRRVPALGRRLALAGEASETISLRAPAAAAAAAASSTCYVARRPIGAGAAIVAGDVERSACAAPETARIRYDRRHGVARAAQDIAQGDSLGRMLTPHASLTQPGQALTLRVAVGATIIERSVEAVQTSHGSAIFVRDAEGRVFSTPLAMEGER